MTRVNIEINEELHKKAKIACAVKGITLIEFINSSVKEKVEKEEHVKKKK
ncbi:hypothetical protein KY339_00040 [Candidatus Woesearchaeota archaeon]|nr:hypothetical protein [Candidatus Woesearchaeota archaeon]